MKMLLSLMLLITTLLNGCKSSQSLQDQDDKSLLPGNWIDDYGISYSIDPKIWKLGSDITFHILEWNESDNYLIVKNDISNAYNAGQYSRIDYVFLKDMDPYSWAYCLTAYDKSTEIEARSTQPADTSNPIKGCNGFPFSRMKVK